MKQSSNDVKFRIEATKEAVAGLQKELLEFDGNSTETARAFVALRGIRDEIEELYKSINKTYDQWKSERLPNAFEAEGVPTVNLEEGYRVTVSEKVFASIRGGKKEAAYQWLRENGLASIVTETVNSSTLSAVAKTMAEENRELDADYFHVHIVPSTSVTKTK